MSLALHSLAFVSGIVAGTSWPLLAALALPVVLCIQRRTALFAVLFLVGLWQGTAVRSAWVWAQSLDGRSGTISATVAEAADRPVGTSVRLVLRQVEGRNVGRGAVAAWLTVPAGVVPGESVLVRCEEWLVRERPGALAFQTPSFRCPRPQVLVRRPPRGIVHWLFRARQRFVQSLEAALPEPAAGLAIGLTLGETATLPPSVVEDFRVTGTSHILALSGYNVTLLVALLLAWLPAVIGKRPALVGIALALIAFVILTGSPPSLLRATAMAGLLLLARWIGRRATAGRALAFTVIALLFIAPALVFDLGFVLSVTSTAGLVVFGERWTARLPGPAFFRQTLGTTLAAIAVTLPLLVTVFGRVSLVAPLANLVVLPVVPALFFASGIVGAVAVVLPGLAAALSVPVAWGMAAFLKTVAWFAHWPAASVAVHLPNWLPWLVPLLFVGAAFRYRPTVCRKCICPERSAYE